MMQGDRFLFLLGCVNIIAECSNLPDNSIRTPFRAVGYLPKSGLDLSQGYVRNHKGDPKYMSLSQIEEARIRLSKKSGPGVDNVASEEVGSEESNVCDVDCAAIDLDYNIYPDEYPGSEADSDQDDATLSSAQNSDLTHN